MVKRSPYEGGSASHASVVSLQGAGETGTTISTTKRGLVLIVPWRVTRADKWRGHAAK